MHMHTYKYVYMYTYAFTSITSFMFDVPWKRAFQVNQRINQNQTGQIGGCVILVHLHYINRAYQRLHVHRRSISLSLSFCMHGYVCMCVCVCTSVSLSRSIWSNLETINRNGNIAAWILHICGFFTYHEIHSIWKKCQWRYLSFSLCVFICIVLQRCLWLCVI